MERTKEDYIDKSYNIFNLLNQFRSNPRQLAHHLEKIKKYLDKNTNVLSEPDKIKIQMIEGEIVFEDAIKYLKKLPPLPPLEWDDILSKSAQAHVDDIGPKGLLTYQSSDGTELDARVSKFGSYMENLGENIDFGPNDEIGVIVSMTLDDGEKERPHRNNLFINDFKKIGIACGPHLTEFQMCVMDFAYEFFPKKQKEENNSDNDLNNIQKDIIEVSENVIPNFKLDIKTSLNLYNDKISNTIYEEQEKKIDNINKTNKKNNNVINNNMNILSEIDQLKLKVKAINLSKKIVKKEIEIFSKVIYKFEDGSTKEVSETKTHVYNI